MKAFGLICWLAIALNFACLAVFYSQPTPNKQLLSMAANAVTLLLLLVSCAVGLRFFSRDKFRGFVPMAICLIGLPVGFIAAKSLGNIIQYRRFERNLPRYTEIVQLIKKEEIKEKWPGSHIYELPSQYSDLAFITRSRTNSEGAIVVEFITGLGFPLKHSGLMYDPVDKLENDSWTLQHWPGHKKIKDNWYAVED